MATLVVVCHALFHHSGAPLLNQLTSYVMHILPDTLCETHQEGKLKGLAGKEFSGEKESYLSTE